MAVSYDELTLIAELFGDAAESGRVFSPFGLTTVDLVTIGQTAFEKRLGLLLPETISLFWEAIVRWRIRNEQFETNPTQDPAPPEEDYIEVKFIPDRETGSESVESDPDDEEVNPGALETSSLEEPKIIVQSHHGSGTLQPKTSLQRSAEFDSTAAGSQEVIAASTPQAASTPRAASKSRAADTFQEADTSQAAGTEIILAVFPKEVKETYYIPRIKKSNPKGKLFSFINNKTQKTRKTRSNIKQELERISPTETPAEDPQVARHQHFTMGNCASAMASQLPC
ncbi:hypothetical protein pipiens_015061 [Culex pipiens pipiens]|uniref:Uncharacterized protein n=2 Tax=Culex pipiens pipiens TaxID=38569 RepID=A0ABD1CS05_CULPP